MAAQEYQTVTTERIGLVERITLNRPEKRNALNVTLQREIVEAVQDAERGGEARVIVLRGAGPSFCAGYDINPSKSEQETTAPRTVEEHVTLTGSYGHLWGNIWNCRIPVIAQVHGYCIAGGSDLALHCDLVLMADDAQIGFPPVRSMGSPPTHMWLYHAGIQQSKRILLTGDTISGVEAARIGLALESVPADRLEARVMELAEHIAGIPHDLLVYNKRIVNLGVDFMGRNPMQMVAAMNDTLAHLAPEVQDYSKALREKGVAGAARERDAKFDR
jgi:enoyl-CoA hydratase